jgi:phenylpropionate dioxygenase-like ring-hydroxylating dioxygenase large terminal subunit
MPAPMTDQRMAERILEHIERRTTDLGDATWREPVANYVSPERFAAELRVLRRWPTPFCPSAALAETGAFVARTAAGTPILAVRDEAGQVRAFRNVCRHRGMEVASGHGCRKAFACPYHAWTYGLDGALKRVPHEHGFPGLDKADYGLVPVQAEEKLGLVFVTQDAPLADVASSLSGWPALLSAEHRLLDVREGEIAANWKVFTESFLEGYHIRPAHTQTFFPYGYDNLNVVERMGPHSRITFPFRRIEALAKVEPQARRVDGLLTYVYHLFPNTFVTMLSSHVNLVVLEPIDLERTRMVVYTLTNRSSEEAERDRAFVDQTGAAEDRAIACAIQRGLNSGANTEFLFGQFESAIVNFHRTLTDALTAAG